MDDSRSLIHARTAASLGAIAVTDLVKLPILAGGSRRRSGDPTERAERWLDLTHPVRSTNLKNIRGRET